MFLASLVDPATGIPARPARSRPVRQHVHPAETEAIAASFIAAQTRTDPLVTLAYQHLKEQTEQQFALLTDPHGSYRITVVATEEATPYGDAAELITSVLTSRILEVTRCPADRAHPLLGRELGGAYDRLRAVHDLVGHVATGYGFDRDGEYSAWLAQRNLYTGLARWAAATELHGEVSALWTTGQFAEHKAVLLDPHLLAGTASCGRHLLKLTQTGCNASGRASLAGSGSQRPDAIVPGQTRVRPEDVTGTAGLPGPRW